MRKVRSLLGERLEFDRETTVITVVSTLLLIIESYFSVTPWEHLDRFVLYLLVPLGVIVFIQGESPREYGLQWGNWRAGAALTLLGLILMTPVIVYLGTRNPGMQDYYRRGQTGGVLGANALDLIGWEFLFRGWILFGYARRYGPDALWLQAVPFAVAHIGKPGVETLSTIFGGFAFGWVAYRTRSFIYPFLIHLFIATLVIYAASSAGG